MHFLSVSFFFFFFNDTATTEIYTLSLHDALPIYELFAENSWIQVMLGQGIVPEQHHPVAGRSEEHTSELQSRQYLVCRLLLEKKKKTYADTQHHRRSRPNFLVRLRQSGTK